MENKELFIERVKEEMAKVEKRIAIYRELTRPVAPDNAIGRVSRMDAINNKSVNDAALREAEQRHRKLLVVLKNINDEDFGICRGCRKPIPEGRLLIRPESSFCVHCAR
jgi:DnaK suppressor protein